MAREESPENRFTRDFSLRLNNVQCGVPSGSVRNDKAGAFCLLMPRARSWQLPDLQKTGTNLSRRKNTFLLTTLLPVFAFSCKHKECINIAPASIRP
jgi:hypothetical protein